MQILYAADERKKFAFARLIERGVFNFGEQVGGRRRNAVIRQN